MLLYIGFCPLLFVVLLIDIRKECCYGFYTEVGLSILVSYAIICAICTMTEALRKNYRNAKLQNPGRGDLEMDGDVKDVPDAELERLSLI